MKWGDGVDMFKIALYTKCCICIIILLVHNLECHHFEIQLGKLSTIYAAFIKCVLHARLCSGKLG